MTNMIWTTLQEYTNEIKEVYGCHLKNVILYGSYARGDQNEESDINLDNDLMIMPIVKNENHFRKWIEAYPFYRNIEKEGVKLYAA